MTPDAIARLNAALQGRYHVESKLGEGGMARVYLATDVKHGRDVALKVLKPELGESIGTERFLREIDIAAKLSHPHILPLFDSGQADGLFYLVMPYVEGESLRDAPVSGHRITGCASRRVRFACWAGPSFDRPSVLNDTHLDVLDASSALSRSFLQLKRSQTAPINLRDRFPQGRHQHVTRFHWSEY